MAGIYVHIPFCRQACHYCDFHFSTNQRAKQEIVTAIGRELSLRKDYAGGESIKTIYLGGGTPSILATDELKDILEAISHNFQIASNPEITLEANPDDLSREKLKDLLELGINRLSIGIQSFNNQVLRFLNRPHDFAAAVKCVTDARGIGFKNISLDLIYAIPGQDDDDWKKNIRQALDLEPVHISSYSLTIEEKTAFGNWVSKGKLMPVPDEKSAVQLEILMNILGDAGFEQYEISNFARPGFHSQHNSSYWKQEKYLGVGPSAHSYNGTTRQYNIPNNYEYLRKIDENIIPCTIENLTPEDKINEYLLTTLRTQWGADLKKLKQDFQYDLYGEHYTYINQLIERKFAKLTDETLILTKPGKLLADKISSDLFLIS